MQYIYEAVKWFVALGASAMLPIVITIIGLIFGVKIGKAIRSGIILGVGFVGIGLIVTLMNDNLGPAAQAMSRRFGMSLQVVDIGWPGMSPLTWASSIAIVAIPVAVLLNVVMLLLKLTHVVNVDIWNIWHFAFTGALVYLATGNYMLGILGVCVHGFLAFKFGDWFAPVVEDYFELDGVCIPHGDSAFMAPFAVPVEWALDRIPGVKKINITSDAIQKRFGEPMIIGAVLGCLIGALAGYDVKGALQLGVQMAAVMVLMPKMVKCIMEGLMPISEVAKAKMEKRFRGAKFYIGLDPAILLGDTQVVSAGLLFVPLTILIAMIVPGNRVLPFGDLATIGFFIAIAVGIHKGNLFRTLISGSIIMYITIWITNQTIPLTTALAKAANSSLLAKSPEIAALDQGGCPITYILTQALHTTNVPGLIVIAVLYIFCIVFTYVQYRKKMSAKAAAAKAEQATEN